MYNFTPRSFYRLMRHVMKNGNKSGDTTEILNFNFTIKNPRDRIVSLERKINLPFGVAEWLSLLTGEGRLRFFKTFISEYDKYSSDGINIDGAYGPRINMDIMGNQIESVIYILSNNKSSRQAVVSLYDGKIDLFSGLKWIPCTETFQFFIRDRRLHMITNMRSNDVYLGVPYDIFSFTMLQEYVASRLMMPLGTYYHNAGSFHIYEPFYHFADTKESYIYPKVMKQMIFRNHEIFMLKVIYDDINTIDMNTATKGMSDYMSDLAWAARAFVKRKEYDEAFLAYEKITDPAIKRVTLPWLKKGT